MSTLPITAKMYRGIIINIVLALVLLPSLVRAQAPLPPPNSSASKLSSTIVSAGILQVVAGQPAPEGTCVGLQAGGDVGMPAFWGHDEKDYYPWTACVKDISSLTRRASRDLQGNIVLPDSDILLAGMQGQQCTIDPLTGGVIPENDAVPIPSITIPVNAGGGNTPVPCAILTEDAGRHTGYFDGTVFHFGHDYVGGCQIDAGGMTLPRQTIVNLFPCEPVWVRAGVVTCATPMPLSWNGNIPATGWANFWATPGGLTLYTTYLHIDTYQSAGMIADWDSFSSVLLPTTSGEPNIFHDVLPSLSPRTGTALTSYCVAPTKLTCGTKASHLHISFAIKEQSDVLNILRQSGGYRIQPDNTARWASQKTGLWWAQISIGMSEAVSMWKDWDETTSVTANSNQCFGTSLSSASLSSFYQRLKTASPDHIPTPAEIMANHSDILLDWMAWMNSFAATTQFGVNSPVAQMTCPSGAGRMAVRDPGYPSGYPGVSRGYSSACWPSFPALASRQCNIFEYIPNHADASAEWQQYQEAAARNLFLNVWWQVYGP